MNEQPLHYREQLGLVKRFAQDSSHIKQPIHTKQINNVIGDIKTQMLHAPHYGLQYPAAVPELHQRAQSQDPLDGTITNFLRSQEGKKKSKRDTHAK